MKYKFFYRYWGCTIEGMLFSPTYKYGIKLPKWIAFKIHTFLNKFVDCGIEGDIKLFGCFPEHENFYDPIRKELVICRMDYLYIFNKSVILWKGYSKPYYVKIKKIKCELRLKSRT